MTKSEPWSRKLPGLARAALRTVSLVWSLHRGATLALATFTVLGGLLPAAIAYVGKRIVDHVVAVYLYDADAEAVIWWVLLELLLVVLLRGLERVEWLTDSILRTLLGQRTNEQILEKALELELTDFEDSSVYDKMTTARRGASYRPLQVVQGSFSFGRHVIALGAYGVLLWQLAPWALVVVVVAALPVFFVNLRFSEDGFRLFRWRAPESRRQLYYETVLAHGAHAKEVKLFDLGDLLLGRYREIFDKHYTEDRDRTVQQAARGYALGLISVFAFYGAYAWIALRAARGEITFGDMTMYLLVFRSSQGSLGKVLDLVRSQYENLLYVSELFAFLDYEPAHVSVGEAQEGPDPSDGLRFENVSFRYPDGKSDVLANVDLHIPPGHKLALVGENGAGKTTLIKLMVGLYRPTEGRVTLDGLDLGDWDPKALRRRVGVIFQDFIRYQMLVGENIGVGDVRHIDDEERWHAAAKKGLAHDMIEDLPSGYRTQLGKWFDDGQELSGGQWQKVALSRAFMREDADLLVLDEPTASMDAEAEMRIFERFRALTEERMAVIISHRFSTVRMADTIAVLHEGAVHERGSHEDLIALGGRYARLFHMQARGYR